MGYCDFLTGFWSSSKGVLDHILLLSQCFCGWARDGSSSPPSDIAEFLDFLE